MMFLTDEELIFLTGKKRRPSQAEALNSMGIEHRVRADGHIIVLREHVESLLGASRNKSLKSIEPDWSMIHA